MKLLKFYLLTLAIVLSISGCKKQTPDSSTAKVKDDSPVQHTDITEKPPAVAPVAPKQQQLLGYVGEMLRYASVGDAVHIVNVPRKPGSFTIKGPSADKYVALLKEAKAKADMQAILGLLAFYKSALKSEATDAELPRYQDLQQEVKDLLQCQFPIVLDPPKEGALPMYLLSVKAEPHWPRGDADGNPVPEPELEAQGNLPVSTPYLNLKASDEVLLEPFEQQPDGRLTVNWNPCYFACWIVYGDESFLQNVKKDIDSHIDENSKGLASKEKLGELKPQDANHERLMFASNYVMMIVKSFESDQEQYLVAATAESCARSMGGIIGKFETLGQSPDQLRDLANNILDGVLLYEPLGNRLDYSDENVAAFSLRSDVEQKTNFLNLFPAPWLGGMFDQPSELICPVGKTVYSVLPPLKYARSLSVFVEATKKRPMITGMQGDVPVVYCPYHHILGLRVPSPGSPDNGRFPYLGSDTNFVCYFDRVDAKWNGPPQGQESFQPRMIIDHYGRDRTLSLRDSISLSDMYKEVIDQLKGQQGVRIEQIDEALKKK